MLSPQARAAITRTRTALARPPVVFVPRCDRPEPQLRETPSPAPRVVTMTVPPRAGKTLTLAAAIDAHIAQVLAECDGNVSEAARRLGVARSSLQRRRTRSVRR